MRDDDDLYDDDLYDDDLYDDDDVYDESYDPLDDDLHEASERLARQVQAIERPGGFCVEGVREAGLPLVEVDGFGALPLPFHPALTEALAAQATPAPYGRGEATIVDPDVRRCLQIDAARVHLDPLGWDELLGTLAEQVAAGLGVPQPPALELYKLLLYREGDFFLPHRDSEKAAGMFATLVVVLPSQFEGGELVVEHQGERQELPVRPPRLDQLAWAAFYADCSHELRPLTGGVRLALVFNVIREGGAEPPERAEAVEAVKTALSHWFEVGDEDKLVYVLEHRYTSGGLDASALKGPDAAQAQALFDAADELGWAASLGVVSLTETWAVEPKRWSRYTPLVDGPEDVEYIEKYDETCRVQDLRDRAGAAVGPARLPVSLDELCPPDALSGERSDEFHVHEASGNEGVSAERIYRRAAVVLWPPSHELQAFERVLDGHGAASQENLELVASALARRSRAVSTFQARDLYSTASRIRSVTARGRLLLAAALEGVETELVREASRAWLADFDAPSPWGRSWWSRESLQALLGLAELVSLPEAEVEALLDAADFDSVVVPAVVALVQAGAMAASSRWARRVEERVRARASVELAPPADWRRDWPEGSCCADCDTVGRFMRSPSEEELRLPLAKARRAHMHGRIEPLDATTDTIRSGRPYTLVITKNQASHDAAVKQRAVDLETLKVLG